MIREASELGLKPGEWPETLKIRVCEGDNEPYGPFVNFRFHHTELRFGEVVAAHYAAEDAPVFHDWTLIILND